MQNITRAHPAISHLLLKCRVATNMSHWLKYSLGGSKITYLRKSVLRSALGSSWIFPILLYYSFTPYYCAIFYSLDALIFQNHQGVLIRSDTMSDLIWVQTLCKGYQPVILFGHFSALYESHSKSKNGLYFPNFMYFSTYFPNI